MSETGIPSNDDNIVVALGTALDVESTSVGLDDLLLALNVNGTIAFVYLELGKRVESGSILDITRRDLETGCTTKSECCNEE